MRWLHWAGFLIRAAITTGILPRPEIVYSLQPRSALAPELELLRPSNVARGATSLLSLRRDLIGAIPNEQTVRNLVRRRLSRATRAQRGSLRFTMCGLALAPWRFFGY